MRIITCFMVRARTPAHDLTAIAEAVTRAAGLQEAFDTLMSEVARVLRSRACIVQRVDRGWMLVGQARGGMRVSISDLQHALEHVPLDALSAAIDLKAIGEGVWTSMALDRPGETPVVLLIAGDWTIVDRLLNPFAVLLSFALAAVRERAARVSAEHFVVEGYTMARRLSRLGPVDAVCQRIVEHAGRSVGAGRVALALYRPEEDRLAIEATHGYPASVVKDVRIEQGAWVIGHVYSSGRPLLVRDIREIHGFPAERRHYRTFSFASIPLRAGRQTLGVLSATDKIDGSAFDRRDIAALRTFGASAALGLIAARSDSEALRLSYAATVDSLTGLFNRRYLDARLHQEVERAKRAASSIAVLMADIDDFKRINDSYGHLTGDAVLRAAGGILRSAVRVFDVSARYGGDEFAVLMPSSDHASAAACAERIRQRIAEYDARENDDLPRVSGMTMSIGVAVNGPGETPADLIRRADLYLYQAKAEGKNRVRVGDIAM